MGLITAACLLLPASAAYAASALDAEEIAFCNTINNYRAQNGLAPLMVSTRLSDATDWHTAEMGSKNYFSHTDSQGRDPFVRMTAFGYNYSTSKGENIAAGNDTAAGTFTQWKNSAGHNSNMLSSSFKVMGIARNYNSASTYKWYWGNNFGGYVDSGAVPCPGSTTTPPPPIVPYITVNNYSVGEGTAVSATVKFTIRISTTSASPVTVRYTTANGTAVAGSDYTAVSGTATINPGATSVVVTVPVTRDSKVEPNEVFYLNLSSPSNATISDAQGNGTIRNDD